MKELECYQLAGWLEAHGWKKHFNVSAEHVLKYVLIHPDYCDDRGTRLNRWNATPHATLFVRRAGFLVGQIDHRGGPHSHHEEIEAMYGQCEFLSFKIQDAQVKAESLGIKVRW